MNWIIKSSPNGWNALANYQPLTLTLTTNLSPTIDKTTEQIHPGDPPAVGQLGPVGSGGPKQEMIRQKNAPVDTVDTT